MKINSIIDLVKDLDTSRQTKNLNKLLIRILLHLQVEFSIQILVSNKILPKGSKQLKGVSPVSYYREKGLYKYTYGENTDYNKILRMKRNITPKFKDAFIIAFKNGEKMNVNEAIKEFKKNR